MVVSGERAPDTRAVSGALTVAFATTDLAFLIGEASIRPWGTGVIVEFPRHPGAADRVAAVVASLPGVVARKAHDGCVVADFHAADVPGAGDPVEVRAARRLRLAEAAR